MTLNRALDGDELIRVWRNAEKTAKKGLDDKYVTFPHVTIQQFKYITLWLNTTIAQHVQNGINESLPWASELMETIMDEVRPAE